MRASVSWGNEGILKMIIKWLSWRGTRVVGVAAINLFLRAPVLGAATLPAGFTEAQVGSNVGSSPTAMAFAPDGRLFVCLQGGQLRVIKNGALLAAPFITLTVTSDGERGLLGVAFDPNFSANNFVYLYYTTSTSPVHNRVSRFTANGGRRRGRERDGSPRFG